MTLKEWIRLVGDDQAARVLRIKPRTARSWREGQRAPRPKDALKIERTLRGKVSFSEIYGP